MEYKDAHIYVISVLVSLITIFGKQILDYFTGSSKKDREDYLQLNANLLELQKTSSEREANLAELIRKNSEVVYEVTNVLTLFKDRFETYRNEIKSIHSDIEKRVADINIRVMENRSLLERCMAGRERCIDQFKHLQGILKSNLEE